MGSANRAVTATFQHWNRLDAARNDHLVRDPQKSHSAVTRAIVDIESPGTPSDGTNVVVIIEEVLEGNWGAAGKNLTLNKIADAVGLSRTGERFKWVRAYFDAKARSYDTAKYPADASGCVAPPLKDIPRRQALQKWDFIVQSFLGDRPLAKLYPKSSHVEYYRSLGLPSPFVEHVIKTSPDSVCYPWRENRLEVSVSTEDETRE